MDWVNSRIGLEPLEDAEPWIMWTNSTEGASGSVSSKKLNEISTTGTLASKYAATNGLTLNQLLSADVSVFN